MNSDRLIETFNTHRMTDLAVGAVTTAREAELAVIMKAVRDAILEPNITPQHLVIYGERGAGKSFLLRMVELEIQRLVKNEKTPVAAALLPEEQYNIRSSNQLLASIVARVKGEDWTRSGFFFETRSQSEAWDETINNLKIALDERFGPNNGLVIAMVENFDILAKDLFGSEPTSDRSRLSARALEQTSSEQLLRRLLSTKGSRIMLIATATGTVDHDYERPLFQIFKAIDLKAWSSDDCIAYFERRHALENKPSLTKPERARVRAIASFIGGNPRLVQLLGDALDTQDARSIASVLDSLSDHLADYYRRRLDDLSPQAAALLDALIRGGEPSTQSALAERVGAAGQSQVADAFSRLVQARLVSAEPIRGEAGTLYRVRDRLFVHFYRRRYGSFDQSTGLAPIAELLEKFFTTPERESIARKHLEAGEWSDARVLAPQGENIDAEFCPYLRRPLFQGLEILLSTAEILAVDHEIIYEELRDSPHQAVKRWSIEASQKTSLLKRVAALAIEAIALARAGLEYGCHELLKKAASEAELANDADAIVIALSEIARFAATRRRDRSLELKLINRIAELKDMSTSPGARIITLMASAARLTDVRTEDLSIKLLEEALEISLSENLLRTQALVHNQLSYHYSRGGKFLASLNSAQTGEKIADVMKVYDLKLHALLREARALRMLDRDHEALITSERAVILANELGALTAVAEGEISAGLSRSRMGQIAPADAAFARALSAAKIAGNLSVQSAALRHIALMCKRGKRYNEALEKIREALNIAIRSESAFEIFTTRKVLLSIGNNIEINDPVSEVRHLINSARESQDLIIQLEKFIPQALAAIARSNAWKQLRIEGSEILNFMSLSDKVRPFSLVGRVWADRANTLGRADFYQELAGNLKDVVDLMEMIPTFGANEERTRRAANLDDALVDFVAKCREPKILIDLAGLLPEIFGIDSEPWPQRLVAFAKVVGASDQVRAVQQLDPDLATLIRTMLNLPDAEDTIAKRGRKKGR